MKKWKFEVKNTPEEIISKLDSSLKAIGGFIFKTNQDKNDSLVFNFRKPVKYPDQILHRNRINVQGKVLKTDAANKAIVEVSFSQHFLMILTVLSIVIFGFWLVVIISRINSLTSQLVFGGLLLLAAIVLWVAFRKKFEKDVQKYKVLISDILES